MKHVRTALVTLGSTALVVAGLSVPTTSVSAKPPPPATVVTDWAALALSTVYPARSVPDGALYLGFTSLAVYDAVHTARHGTPRRGRASVHAAAAVAAHDVLEAYFPAAEPTLDSALAADLAAVRDGPGKTRGIRIGGTAAAEMIASRVGDGRNDPAVVYPKAPAVGIWRPTPPNNAPMALPWFGHVKPLLLDWPTEIKTDGTDPLTSAAYAADYDEVRTTGAATGATRTEAETLTAKFYNANANLQVQAALLALLETKPLGVVRTARLFALINAGVADALITTWRLKLDSGFWRPLTAIHEADQDGNAATTADPTWTPLIDTLGGMPAGSPPYPEWPSGHASVINAFTEAVTLVTGTTSTDLTVFSSVTSSTKHYRDLRVLSQDAFLARIWLGIHFRDAMEDARYIGRQAVRLGDSRLP